MKRMDLKSARAIAGASKSMGAVIASCDGVETEILDKVIAGSEAPAMLQVVERMLVEVQSRQEYDYVGAGIMILGIERFSRGLESRAREAIEASEQENA